MFGFVVVVVVLLGFVVVVVVLLGFVVFPSRYVSVHSTCPLC